MEGDEMRRKAKRRKEREEKGGRRKDAETMLKWKDLSSRWVDQEDLEEAEEKQREKKKDAGIII